MRMKAEGPGGGTQTNQTWLTISHVRTDQQTMRLIKFSKGTDFERLSHRGYL